MVISTQNVIAQFHYSETEKFQLYKCIRMHSQKGIGSTAKCCDLFWDKISSCCNQSSWDRALKTIRERLSYHPDCPRGYEAKVSEFLIRYLISKETVRAENVPLLPNQKRKPMDLLVAHAGEIDFFDLFHRVPYSEDALSYPDRVTLFSLFKKEFKDLDETAQKISNALSTNPVIQAAKRVQVTLDGMINRAVSSGISKENSKSSDSVIDQFEEGINEAKKILDKARPFLQERNFQMLSVQQAYLYYKTLALFQEKTLSLNEMMTIFNKRPWF